MSLGDDDDKLLWYGREEAVEGVSEFLVLLLTFLPVIGKVPLALLRI